MLDVLIVGAGPTGLTLACELAVRGIAFQLVDAADGPFSGSRAKGLQPRSLEVFDRLGIVNEVMVAGSVELPYRQHAPDGSHRDVPRLGLETRPDVPWPSPLLIPQWRTEEALRARLAALGGEVEYGRTLTDVVADDQRVRAALERDGHAETVEAAWLVGCDGGRSTVRRAAGLTFIGETNEDMRMLVGDMSAQGDGLDREHWHVWRSAEGGFMAMAPMAGTESFQVQIALGPKTPDATTLENFQRLVDHYTGGTVRLSAPTWMSLWRANVRMVDHYRAGRLFVAGDAAHVHTPAGGQGMNTGIQDAFNLGWKLAAVLRGADESLLDSYEAERLPVAQGVLGLSNKLAAIALSSSTGGVIARNEDVFQLGIHYRESPLTQELRAAPGSVQAGDRAPDATGLRDSAGRTCRLFDTFRGPQATLLAFGAAALTTVETVLAASGDALRGVCVMPPGADLPASPSVCTWIDTEGHAASAWEPGAGALFVVRPDGVIGFATDAFDAGPLQAWLQRAGLTR